MRVFVDLLRVNNNEEKVHAWSAALGGVKVLSPTLSSEVALSAPAARKGVACGSKAHRISCQLDPCVGRRQTLGAWFWRGLDCFRSSGSVDLWRPGPSKQWCGYRTWGAALQCFRFASGAADSSPAVSWTVA